MKRLLWLIPLLLMLSAMPASATVYWLDDGGSDANACSAIDSADESTDPGVYKATFGSACDCLGTSDTLMVKDGTYSTPTNAFAVVYACGPDGTPSAQTTIKSQNLHGAIIAPSGDRWGILVADDYQTYDGFVIDGIGQTFVNIGKSGFFNSSQSNIIATRMEVKNTLCEGLSSFQGNNVQITYNYVHDQSRVSVIGGGAHCNGPTYGHGIYTSNADILIEGNYLEDIGGYGIHVYSSGSIEPTDRTVIRKNFIKNWGFHGNDFNCAIIATSGTDLRVYENIMSGGPMGICTHSGTVDQWYVLNNTIYDVAIAGIYMGTGLTNAVVKNNAIDAAGSGAPQILNAVGGGTFGGNACRLAGTNCAVNGDLLFVNVATDRFDLQDASPAIGAGVTLNATECGGTFGSMACASNGTPSAGAFRPWGFVSGSVETATPNTACFSTNAIFQPILPATGITGISDLLVAAGARTASSVVRSGSGGVCFTISGAAVAALETVTFDILSTTNLTDSMDIGRGPGAIGSGKHQRITLLNNQALTNNVDEALSAVSQCVTRWGVPNKTMAGQEWMFGVSAAAPCDENTSCTAPAGGKVRLYTGICNESGVNTLTQAYALYCSLNGGAAERVTTTTGATLKIAYHTVDANVSQGTLLTNVLSNAGLTFQSGGGWSTGGPNPPFPVDDNRQVQRGHSLILSSTFAIDTDTLTCRERTDAGEVLDAYVDSTLTGRASIAFSK